MRAVGLGRRGVVTPLIMLPCSYAALTAAAEGICRTLSRALPQRVDASGHGPRVGIYAAPGAPYVAATWAAWMVGGVAVPLAVSHPAKEIAYVLEDAGVSAVSGLGARTSTRAAVAWLDVAACPHCAHRDRVHGPGPRGGMLRRSACTSLCRSWAGPGRPGPRSRSGRACC